MAELGIVNPSVVGSNPAAGANSKVIMIYKTDKERLVVESLIKRELLPQFGDFEITEHLLIAYCETYRTLFGKTDYVPKKTQSFYAKK